MTGEHREGHFGAGQTREGKNESVFVKKGGTAEEYLLSSLTLRKGGELFLYGFLE